MPELITISGLSDDTPEAKPEAKAQPTPVTATTSSGHWMTLLAFGGVAAGIYLLTRLFPLKSGVSVKVDKNFRIVGLEDCDDDYPSYDGQMGVIRKCKPKDKTKKRPAKDQKMCLFTKDGKRLLGRHPNKEKALRQERLIEMKKHGR